jgi:DNA topoisomerase IA
MKFQEFIESNNIELSIFQDLGLLDKAKDVFDNDKIALVEKKQILKQLILSAFTEVSINEYNENKDEDLEIKDENNDEINETSDQSLSLKPQLINGEKIGDVENSQTASEVKDKLLLDPFYDVRDITFTKMSYKPRKPFITSTLQQAASSFLGFNPKLTMSLAQKLYEGVEVNGEQTALITYMRTDSYNLSSFSIEQIREYLAKYHAKFLPSQPRIYTSKSKNSQEAHEAIRPTNIFILPKDLKIDNSLFRLYDLIWKNTVCSQMTDQIKEKKSFHLVNNLGSKFSGSFIKNIESGWREVFNF